MDLVARYTVQRMSLSQQTDDLQANPAVATCHQRNEAQLRHDDNNNNAGDGRSSDSGLMNRRGSQQEGAPRKITDR